MPPPPTDEDPRYHAGRALFAAITGDEAGVERALHQLFAHDGDGRHRRWAVAEGVFAPFYSRGWFATLCAPAADVPLAGLPLAGVAPARPPAGETPRR